MHRAPGTLNKGYIIGFSAFPTNCIKFVCFNNSMQIKKGNSDGITLFTQSKKLFRAEFSEDFAKKMIQIKNTTSKIGKRSFLALTTYILFFLLTKKNVNIKNKAIKK